MKVAWIFWLFRLPSDFINTCSAFCQIEMLHIPGLLGTVMIGAHQWSSNIGTTACYFWFWCSGKCFSWTWRCLWNIVVITYHSKPVKHLYLSWIKDKQAVHAFHIYSRLKAFGHGANDKSADTNPLWHDAFFYRHSRRTTTQNIQRLYLFTKSVNNWRLHRFRYILSGIFVVMVFY